ncbi:SbtR family transcriptional regulator [Nonomuraea sp. NPDC004297]
MRRFVTYFSAKRALAEALSHDAELFRSGRAAIQAAGEPLEAGAARPDAAFDDVLRLVAGLTVISFADPGQFERVLTMALDGLRPWPEPVPGLAAPEQP